MQPTVANPHIRQEIMLSLNFLADETLIRQGGTAIDEIVSDCINDLIPIWDRETSILEMCMTEEEVTAALNLADRARGKRLDRWPIAGLTDEVRSLAVQMMKYGFGFPGRPRFPIRSPDAEADYWFVGDVPDRLTHNLQDAEGRPVTILRDAFVLTSEI